MALWIPITIFAAFMQNLRSTLQKYLKGQLSTSGATYSRFVYAMPLALLYLAGLVFVGGYALPELTGRFWVFALIGGAAQIAATALLVAVFSFRNFVVGTTFSKTETVQTAVFGIFVLGETLTLGAVVGIGISLAGVLMIALTKVTFGTRDLLKQAVEPSALIGIGSGACFGISAVAYRAASLSLGSGDFIIRAALVLACATVFQTVVMSIYMGWREPGQIRAVFTTWRISSLVGLVGVLGSIGWITAMTLQNAAYVRALGQVELLFTFAVSYFYFREAIARVEFLGICLVTLGILLLVFIH